jgi:hypothetical protein
VTDEGTADDATGGGRGLATAFAELIAGKTAGAGADEGPAGIE